MFAIQNKRTGKWVSGTNWDRNGSAVQFTDFDEALTWADRRDAEQAFEHRQCDKDYEIVECFMMPVSLIPEAMKPYLKVRKGNKNE